MGMSTALTRGPFPETCLVRSREGEHRILTGLRTPPPRARGWTGVLHGGDPSPVGATVTPSRRRDPSMTMYLPNPDVQPTGSEITEFVDVPPRPTPAATPAAPSSEEKKRCTWTCRPGSA